MAAAGQTLGLEFQLNSDTRSDRSYCRSFDDHWLFHEHWLFDNDRSFNNLWLFDHDGPLNHDGPLDDGRPFDDDGPFDDDRPFDDDGPFDMAMSVAFMTVFIVALVMFIVTFALPGISGNR